MRPVDGRTIGQLLHDQGVPILVLNACQSAMHQATAAPKASAGIHEEVRAIGSLAQAVIDQGVPAVLGGPSSGKTGEVWAVLLIAD